MSSEPNTPPGSVPPARARASIADVAVHAGVSAQTVSRVANGLTSVRPETRERVQASMRALGYRPNSAARNLKSGRFRSIGFVTFNLTSVGNALTMNAVAAAAEAAGYTTTLLPLTEKTQQGVAGAFGRLEEQAVDGIILVMSSEVGSIHDTGFAGGVPLVIVDADDPVPYTNVDTDQEQGARSAVQHLLELGHRDIVHLAGPADSFPSRRRADAFRSAMREAGLTPRPVAVGDWSASSGRDRMRALLAAGPAPTAVFAANDHMALGVLNALHEAGLRVPHDVSVVGFDDTAEAALYWPPLTTVHQNLDEVGRRASALLLALIDGAPDLAQRTVVSTRLVVRGSTGPARRA